MLITEQGGRLLRVRDGRAEAVSGVPAVSASGQGGLLDLAVSPSFSADRTIFFTYSQPGPGGAGTALARAVLDGTSLRDVRTIWSMERKTGAGQHFGSRIRFLPDGTILFSTGDRGQGPRSQDLGDDAGKVHRIAPDGSVPADNPFRGNRAARPSVYSYGHRNPQGLAIHPVTREPWITEHGPQGGDEVNILRPGRNYGWPVITYGRQYGTGATIGEGTAKAGMEQPLIHWTPSIAPSGLDFYTGDAFPRWKGNLFSGNLAGRRLMRMTVSDTAVLTQEVLLEGAVGRIRDVRQGSDGFLYILTDESPGAVYRLEPGE
jgi:glucose/arabinose dehydrogenase